MLLSLLQKDKEKEVKIMKKEEERSREGKL
jgi:hypothetical protein